MRKCNKCGKEKPDSMMVRRGAARNFSIAPLCKECRNKTRRKGTGHYCPPRGIIPTGFTPFKKGNIPHNKGIPLSEETKKKLSAALSGRVMSEESIEKTAKANRKSKRRKSWKYNNWAKLVKERDGYVCQHCGLSDIDKLQSHHIIPWEDCEKLRFDLSNGLTLCRSCHTKEDRRIKPLTPWNKGGTLSAEHRKKISDAHKGKIPWNKGKKMSPEICAVMSECRIGKPSNKKGVPSGYKGKRWRVCTETGKRIWYDKTL